MRWHLYAFIRSQKVSNTWFSPYHIYTYSHNINILYYFHNYLSSRTYHPVNYTPSLYFIFLIVFFYSFLINLILVFHYSPKSFSYNSKLHTFCYLLLLPTVFLLCLAQVKSCILALNLSNYSKSYISLSNQLLLN